MIVHEATSDGNAMEAGLHPAGCDIRLEGDDACILRASTRDLGGAVGIGIFAVIWNGILSLFVFFNVSATLYCLGVPMGLIFEKPLDMSLWSCGFIWVVLTPFMLIGAGLASLLLVKLAGRIEVKIKPGAGEVATGFGPVQWRRRFTPEQVEQVTLDQAWWKENDARVPAIKLDSGDTSMKFGTQLSRDSRDWLIAALRQALMESRHDKAAAFPADGSFGRQAGWS